MAGTTGTESSGRSAETTLSLPPGLRGEHLDVSTGTRCPLGTRLAQSPELGALDGGSKQACDPRLGCVVASRSLHTTLPTPHGRGHGHLRRDTLCLAGAHALGTGAPWTSLCSAQWGAMGGAQAGPHQAGAPHAPHSSHVSPHRPGPQADSLESSLPVREQPTPHVLLPAAPPPPCAGPWGRWSAGPCAQSPPPVAPAPGP